MSAFAAALFVRRSTAGLVPGPTAPPAPTGSLASRALSVLDVGVVVLDRDETAILANPVARRMRVVDGDRLTLPVLSELVRSVTDTGAADSVTLDLSTPGRGPEHVSFLVRAMPLPDGGRVGSVVLRFSDITDARRLELVRRDFVANVSHELKTPATSLKLLAESLAEILEEDPEQARFFVRQLRSETERLAQLITDLLDLARLESEEGVQNPQPVDVRGVLMVALARLRPAARRKNITLSWKRSGNAALYAVRGDETQLVSMFANLVDNAIKYTPPGGRVEVSGEPSEGEVVVRVSDTGIGIPPENLSRIFERFYRVDKARSKATGGTGLGLSIVRHIVENHGGRVAVESELGGGSTFTVYLPR